MIEIRSQHEKTGGIPYIGAQPIALAAGALIVIVLAVGGMALSRAYTGASPEPDRIVVTRQLQARTAQTSEQLVEKTKGLEATQQETIDQLQVVQDQLQTVKRLLAAQQADTKRLSEQVATLTESIDGLRKSFASTQASETETPSVARHKPARHRAQASTGRRG